MVAIGVAFAVYLVSASALVTFVALSRRPIALGWIIFMLACIAMPVLVLPSLVHEDLSTFGAAQMGGLVTFGLLAFFYVWELRQGYKKSRTVCPECSNVVLASARVCHYCGYRWKPPLPSTY